MVKRALERNERRLEQTYPLYTEAGVIALLNNMNTVWGEALKGNYDALILLLDLEQALADIFLTAKQLQAIRLVFIDDLSPEEARVIMGVEHERRVRAHIEAAAKKIARYLAGTEGYVDGRVC